MDRRANDPSYDNISIIVKNDQYAQSLCTKLIIWGHVELGVLAQNSKLASSPLPVVIKYKSLSNQLLMIYVSFSCVMRVLLSEQTCSEITTRQIVSEQ